MRQKIVITLTLILGIVTTLLGPWLLAGYLKEISIALRSPDSSFIFWGIPALAISVGATGLGITMVVFSLWSIKRSSIYPIVRVLLIVSLIIAAIGTTLVVGDEISTKKSTISNTETTNIVNSLNKISAITIGQYDNNGFNIVLDMAGGHKGKYTLAVAVLSDQTNLYDLSEQIALDENPHRITKSITFRDLFKICRTDRARLSRVYVCVNNAGTNNSVFQVDASLTYISSPSDTVQIPVSRLNFERSAATVKFAVDTLTNNNDVSVSNFKIVN